MGLFFQKRSYEKSAKPIIVIRTLMAISMGILLVMGIINGLDFFFLRLIFILAGVGSFMDGVESYFQRENKRVYLVDFGFAILWFIFSFQLSD
ncbi:hypothetical protein ACFFIX_27410 [Metabacillus herbersteinensis]|uniref:DUF4181 domain-containing protein n=1 Tax=Metabacillus herbersteinensis TaxID=283816 RepID=A0ABV6GMV8_9BACI